MIYTTIASFTVPESRQSLNILLKEPISGYPSEVSLKYDHAVLFVKWADIVLNKKPQWTNYRLEMFPYDISITQSSDPVKLVPIFNVSISIENVKIGYTLGSMASYIPISIEILRRMCLKFIDIVEDGLYEGNIIHELIREEAKVTDSDNIKTEPIPAPSIDSDPDPVQSEPELVGVNVPPPPSNTEAEKHLKKEFARSMKADITQQIPTDPIGLDAIYAAVENNNLTEIGLCMEKLGVDIDKIRDIDPNLAEKIETVQNPPPEEKENDSGNKWLSIIDDTIPKDHPLYKSMIDYINGKLSFSSLVNNASVNKTDVMALGAAIKSDNEAAWRRRCNILEKKGWLNVSSVS